MDNMNKCNFMAFRDAKRVVLLLDRRRLLPVVLFVCSSACPQAPMALDQRHQLLPLRIRVCFRNVVVFLLQRLACSILTLAIDDTNALYMMKDSTELR